MAEDGSAVIRTFALLPCQLMHTRHRSDVKPYTLEGMLNCAEAADANAASVRSLYCILMFVERMSGNVKCFCKEAVY